jgi:hypothetical protein
LTGRRSVFGLAAENPSSGTPGPEQSRGVPHGNAQISAIEIFLWKIHRGNPPRLQPVGSQVFAKWEWGSCRRRPARLGALVIEPPATHANVAAFDMGSSRICFSVPAFAECGPESKPGDCRTAAGEPERQDRRPARDNYRFPEFIHAEASKRFAPRPCNQCCSRRKRNPRRPFRRHASTAGIGPALSRTSHSLPVWSGSLSVWICAPALEMSMIVQGSLLSPHLTSAGQLTWMRRLAGAAWLAGRLKYRTFGASNRVILASCENTGQRLVVSFESNAALFSLGRRTAAAPRHATELPVAMRLNGRSM